MTSASPASYDGFTASPQDCNNLSSVDSVEPRDAIAKLLKTTRNKKLDERKVEKRRTCGGRLPRGSAAEIDRRLTATTTFDFVWRSRTRANYGSPAMFHKGALGSLPDCLQYVNALRSYSNATMLMFEAFISQRARSVLAEAATDFISRDRSQQSDQCLGRRMRELGVLR